MKAIVFDQYGSPDVLRLEEVELPSPKYKEVLIEVKAVSLNASDMEFLTGSPAYIRMWGLRKPAFRILGSDIAGKVVSVGEEVTQFQIGDEVMGDILGKFGGLAQYVCAAEKSLVKKSKQMTFEEAAAFPQAGVVALQGIRDRKKLEPGHKVLINGAGGGSGTFAIQLAKLYGAEVTGVDNGEKLDLMQAVGADHVYNYKETDFTRLDLQFDLILDLVAHRSLYDWKRIMAPESAYALVGGSVKRILHSITLGPILSKFGNKKMGLLAVKPNQEEMLHLNDLFEGGKIKPVIDQVFTLEEAPDAFQILCNGQAKGKLVIALH